MWQESAGLWQASEGILGVLAVLICFGFIAQFAAMRTHRRQRRKSVQLELATKLPIEHQSVGAAKAASNQTTFELPQREIDEHALQAAGKG